MSHFHQYYANCRYAECRYLECSSASDTSVAAVFDTIAVVDVIYAIAEDDASVVDVVVTVVVDVIDDGVSIVDDIIAVIVDDLVVVLINKTRVRDGDVTSLLCLPPSF